MAGQVGPDKPFPTIGGITFKQATFAENRTEMLGRRQYISKGIFGKGLFANSELHAGDVICAQDGEIVAECKTKDRPTTHFLRMKDTGIIIDGLYLSKDLKWDEKDQKQWPDHIELWSLGFACIANSSAGGVSNAVIAFLRDDRTHRAPDQDPETQEHLSPTIVKHIGLRAYLIAIRDIPKDTEVLWYQNPTLSPKK